MSIRGALTGKGGNIAVFPTDDVGLIFEKVTEEGFTSVTKTETGPEPPTEHEVLQYYDIKTTAKRAGTITIRIILRRIERVHEKEGTREAQLWQWNSGEKQWTNITTHFSREYHLVIGETSHLSIFGVTR